MAKPRAKLPQQVVTVICSQCKQVLFKYHKNGKGSLVKCFIERIAKNYCQKACYCPKCDTQFAREQLIRGAPAYKIIGGKAHIK